MSVYEKENTRNIISRLEILRTSLKAIMVASWVVVLGSLLAIGGAFFGYWWMGAIVGILLGFGFGIYFSSMLILMTDWMTQMLIAQDETIRKMNPP